jgi:FKBP-type peptidyl-prolyl cis-trans isomerase
MDLHFAAAPLGALVFAALAALAAPAFAAPALAPAEAAPMMHVLPQIQYQVLASGDPAGPHPKRSDTVRVNYEVKLMDGTVIDSSFKAGQPVEFPLMKLIPGWQAVVPLMRPGDDWRVLIPAEFAYGAAGKGPIPGGAQLDFRIQLIAVVAPPAPPAPAPASH